MSYAGRMDKREDAVKLLNQLKAKGFKPIIKDLN
jgi:pentatricopeptide repeat protein